MSRYYKRTDTDKSGHCPNTEDGRTRTTPLGVSGVRPVRGVSLAVQKRKIFF